MSRSYSSHSGYAMALLCENKFSQLLWLAFSCLCCSNWRDTRRLSLHEVLRWKHSTDKMRKLKKELVCSGVGRYNMGACNAAFHSALDVCLNCGVSIEPAAEILASAAACAGRRKEIMLVLL